jgi:carbonic anhydrase
MRYKPTGIARFHTPAEHAFSNGNPYDVEMEVFYEDEEKEQAIVSVFFDRTMGGASANEFITSLNLGVVGIE